MKDRVADKCKKVTTKRRPGEHKSQIWGALLNNFGEQIGKKTTLQNNVFILTRAKCWSRDYDTAIKPSGCSQDVRPHRRWSRLGRKTKGQ